MKKRMLKLVVVSFFISSGYLASTFGQSVVVNEMSQGSGGNKEWVELLVVDDNVDMRGWEVGDNDDDGAGSVWHSLVEFTSNANWSAVNSGTLIVIYNGGDIDGTIVGSDLDFADNVVLIPHDNTNYFIDTGSWPSSGAFANSDTDDSAAIRNLSDTMIHDMAVTHPVATVSSPGAAQVKYFNEDSVSEILINASWTTAASTAGTPGAGNGGNNSSWVSSLLGGGSGPSTNVRFVVSTGSANESVGTFNVTVIKSLPEGNVTGEVQISGSATEGALDDFTIGSTNFTLNGATTSATIIVSIVDDGNIELAETVILTLANISGGTISAPSVFTLTILDDDTPPSSLFISEVADPTNNFNARFVEFYNAGTNNVDLASGTWFLSKQVNGGSWADISLTGTVTAGSTFVIAFSESEFLAAYPSASTPNQYSGDINGNGDDGYYLYSGGDHTLGTLADAYGVFNVDGTGQPWEYLDTRAVRTSTVVQGSTVWDASEWFIPVNASTDDMTPGVHPEGPIVPTTNVKFNVSADSVLESAGVYIITVLKTSTDGDVSGEIALSGTSTEGGLDDYTIESTNFTLNGSVTSTNIVITINDDAVQEASETIILSLVNVIGGSISAPAAFTLTILANDAPPPSGGLVWINEINYNPAGTDSNEFVEIAGPAGIDLSDYQLFWYNGSGGVVYGSNQLSGVIGDEGCGYGAISFSTPNIQNGPDGFALVSNNTIVLEFISYDGSFLATDGPAIALNSINIGVVQTNVNDTVQLGGSGNASSEFAWEVAAASSSNLNVNQSISPCGGEETPPVLSAIGNKIIQESNVLVFAVSATPTDSDTVILTVSNAPAGSVFTSTNENGNFTWATPTPTGVYTVSFYASDNDGTDSETITITVTTAPPVIVPGGMNLGLWINEIHYDNTGVSGDTNEGFEVAGAAGVDLADYSMYLYDGVTGGSYSNIPLSGVIPNLSNGYGVIWFGLPYTIPGEIQNGSADGMALVYLSTGVVQFISYEGVINAVSGPASGSSSVDIGASEPGTTPENFALQLCGTGTNYAQMVATGGWITNLNSRGAFTSCQVIPLPVIPSTTIDEYEIDVMTLSGSTFSVTINMSSNGVPYTLIYTTNILTNPQGSGTADTENGTGGAIILQDSSPTNPSRLYWIRSN